MRPPNAPQRGSSSPVGSALRDADAARRLGLDRDPTTAELIELRLLRPEDSHIAGLLRQRVADGAATEALAPNPFRATAPSPAEVARGEILLGYESFSGAPAMLPLQAFNEGVGIYGRTGCGKTCAVYELVLGLMGNSVSCLCLDCKVSLRHLAPLAPERLRVFGLNSFPFALFEPPAGVPARAWAGTSAGIVGHAFGLQSASVGLFIRVLDHLYTQSGVYDGTRDYPSLDDVVAALRQPPFRLAAAEQDYRARLLARLTPLAVVSPHLGRIRRSVSLGEWIAEGIVLDVELHDANSYHQAYLAAVAIMNAYAHQLARGLGPGLELVLVVDEAASLFPVTRAELDGDPGPVCQVIPRLREARTGLLLGTQLPSRLSPAVVAATGTRVAMSLSDGREAAALGAMMGLSREQTAWMLRLPRAEGIVRSVSGDTVEPYLIRVPETRVSDKSIATDDYIRQHMQPVWDELLPQVGDPAPTEGAALRVAVPQLAGGAAEPRTAQRGARADGPEPASPTSASELSVTARRLLMDCASSLYRTVTEHGESIGVSGRQLEGARKELEGLGFVTAHPAPTGMRGGVPVLLEPTQRGWDEVGLPRPIGDGRGSVVHRYWQAVIARWAEQQGAERVEIEAAVAGKAIDVLIHMPSEDQAWAVEVELAAVAHVAANLRLDLGTGSVGRVTAAVPSRDIGDRIASMVREQLPDQAQRVDIRALGTFRTARGR